MPPSPLRERSASSLAQVALFARFHVADTLLALMILYDRR